MELIDEENKVVIELLSPKEDERLNYLVDDREPSEFIQAVNDYQDDDNENQAPNILGTSDNRKTVKPDGSRQQTLRTQLNSNNTLANNSNVVMIGSHSLEQSNHISKMYKLDTVGNVLKNEAITLSSMNLDP